MLHCFDEASLDAAHLDREGFKFRHTMLGHPALELSNLARVIPALPKGHVYYSKGLRDRKANFDLAHVEHPNGLSIEETIENIRTSDSYIMVRQPEHDPSFQPVFRELLADVEALMQARGVGTRAVDAKLYLFIASPDSITPFHFDRFSTILLQFRGAKQVTVFPPWDERVFSARECEAFMAHTGYRPVWNPEIEPLGTCFDFAPGEAIHIPFVSGHHVRNGPSDVSISMSIIFNTKETQRQVKALLMNYMIGRTLGRVGIAPANVGIDPRRDAMKAAAWRGLSGAYRLVRPRQAA